MPRIHRAAMADLKRQKEQKELNQKIMFGRAVTDRNAHTHFSQGKWRNILKHNSELSDQHGSFTFKNRKKFYQIMLDHEKKNRVSK